VAILAREWFRRHLGESSHKRRAGAG
jgi:hypothetical protein